MKTIIMFATCLIVALSGIKTDEPTGNELIELRGLLDYNHNSNDVVAYVDQGNMYVIFNRSFGSVNITLYNPEDQIIYSDVVNTLIQHQVIIPITNLMEGVYTLFLESSFGFAEGGYEGLPL